jgi:glycosyltransferase involved in cell wall biosynthesis
MLNKKYVVYLGSSGFPYGLAENQKVILISKCLLLTGNAVTIICHSAVHRKSDHPDMKACGNFENIEYVYTIGSPFRDKNSIKQNLLLIKGVVNEFFLLNKMKKAGKLDFAILNTHNFYKILFYSIVSKLIGFKTVLNYVEFFSGVKKKWFRPDIWLNDKLYDQYAPVLADSVFPISEFLIQHIKKISPGKNFLKIPVLTDFERYNDLESLQVPKYFLFCGSASYTEIIKFIIDSFNRLNNTSTLLYLVINGEESEINEIKKYIGNTIQKDNIKIFSRLTDRQLSSYYKHAIALLIPLRPTFQDIARFPHKIGEYLASGNPVISTNYGEVKHYFRDMENMLLADNYDVKFFSEKMQFVIDNPGVAKSIGAKGKDAACPIFDYRNKAASIDIFLNNQVKNIQHSNQHIKYAESVESQSST